VEIDSQAHNVKYCPEHRGKAFIRKRDGVTHFKMIEMEFESVYRIKPTPEMLEKYKAWKRGENAAYRNNVLYKPFIEEL